jgi:hypothetical protein
MAATAWAYRYEFLQTEPNGNPTLRLDVHLTDPATVATQAPRHINILLTLDATSPNQYTQQTRNAIIAAGAAQLPPFVLNAADVIISAFG